MYADSSSNRICVGMYMADATMWAAIACVLPAFDITKKKNETGQDIDIEDEYTDGFIRWVVIIYPRFWIGCANQSTAN